MSQTAARPPSARNRRAIRRRRLAAASKYLFLSAFTAVTVFVPLWLLVVNSAKPLAEASALNMRLPHDWAMGSNYKTVVTQGAFFEGLRNTLVITVPTLAGLLLFGALAAWIFARGKSRTLTWLYYLSVSGILIPPAVVTSILVLRKLSIYGTHFGITLFYIGALMSFAIFFMTGFVRTIPIELEEAARMDGASDFRVFRKVILPLLRPILATTFVVLLLAVWNDFFWPFYLLPGEHNETLMLGLFNFFSQYQYSISWNLVFADVVLVSLPLVIVYFFAQRRILSSLMSGAVNR